MQDMKTQRLVQSALMASLCLLLTKVITIPTPTGYMNLGDCAVLLSAWLLGPVFGGMAAGVGAMLADVLGGYASYAPGTFVIKFIMAAVAALIFHKRGQRYAPAAWWIGAFAAEEIMVAGYYLYESVVLGVGLAAAASVPTNICQGFAGAVSGILVMRSLSKADFGFYHV